MKRTLLLVLFGALIVAGAGRAHATPLQDSQYVQCVSEDGLVNAFGPEAQALIGRAIVYDISMGVRSPYVEAIQVRLESNGLTQADANTMVNCATEVWLGYGPEGPHGQTVA